MALPQEVAVIIPALNESSTIGDVVSAVKRYGTVYVVDDGSDDNTGEVAAEAGALVVTHSSNLGYDSALNSGFARAARDKVRFFVTVDADGQHKTQLLEEFILRLEEGFDVVLGERTSLPRFFEKVFSLFTRIKYSIKDPFCGMKGYSRPVYESLGHFDSYSSVGTEPLRPAYPACGPRGWRWRRLLAYEPRRDRRRDADRGAREFRFPRRPQNSCDSAATAASPLPRSNLDL